jgi:endonuclease/exonuclease/phosphatase family metal-dependent hydrolase
MIEAGLAKTQGRPAEGRHGQASLRPSRPNVHAGANGRPGRNHRPVVASLLALMLCSIAQAQPRFRIVTFNVECLAAPNTRDSRLPRFRWDVARCAHLERVASIVETLDADVVNLLEVTSAAAVHRLVRILHEKGLTDYQGYHVESEDGFTGFDVAVLTKWRPDSIEGVPIRCVFSPPGDPTWREKFTYRDQQGADRHGETSIQRNALYFITVAGHRLGFLGLHLKSDPSDAYANARRTAEAAVARRIIGQEIVARGYLPIVLGDLNDYDPDVPDRDPDRSTATQVLANLKDYDPTTPGPELFSAAQRIVRPADRYTCHWDRNENGAVDSDDVMTMIDHILLPARLMKSVQRVFVSHCSDLTTSDHWPVVVDLEWPPDGPDADQ